MVDDIFKRNLRAKIIGLIDFHRICILFFLAYSIHVCAVSMLLLML